MAKSKRNRGTAPIPAKKTPKDAKKNVTTIQQELRSEQFQGPIPPPQILNGYEQLLPGAADRIIRMAEKEGDHRHRMETKAVDAEIHGLKCETIDTRIGQIFGLVIGLTTVLAGTYAAVQGSQVAGSLIGTSGVVGLVSAFIVGRKKATPINGNSQSKEVVPVEEK